MTGNNKVWRAPLAGLASVAMLATMGVAASTANAAGTPLALPAASTVTAGSTTNASVYPGETLADALRGVPAAQPATNADGNFAGWYDGDKLADFSSKVFGDKTLKAKYVSDTVKVTFQGINGAGEPQFALYNAAADGSLYVPTGSTLAGYTPVDLPDQKIVTSWKVTKTTVSASGTTTTEDTVADLSKVKTFKGQTITIEPAADGVSKVKTASFTLPASTLSGTYVAGGKSDGTVDNTYEVDVDAEHPAKAPATVYKLAGTLPTNLPQSFEKWDSEETAAIAKGGDVTVGAKYTPIDLQDSVLVEFASSESASTASSYDLVPSGSNLTAGNIPSKDNWAAKGWTKSAESTGTVTGDGTNDAGYVVDFGALKVKANGTAANDNFVVFAAQYASKYDVEVKFHYGDYAGAPKDATQDLKAADYVTEPEAPTRDGYTFQYWYLTNKYTPFNFDAAPAGEVNGGDSFTLTAYWIRDYQDKAIKALKYVQPDGDWDKDLDVNYGVAGYTKTDGSDFQKDWDATHTVPVLSYSAISRSDATSFTDASFKEFKTAWTTAYKTYESAVQYAQNDEISEADANKVISALEDAWKGLRFNADSADTVLDGTNGAGAAKIIYRLYNPSTDSHLYTGDENEVKYLTNKYTGQGGWNLDDTRFRAVNTPRDSWVSGKVDNVEFTPLVNKVVRLYNNREHLYTADQDEIKALKGNGWVLDSDAAAILVPALYQTDTKVTRLYDPAKDLHLYSSDSNEIKVLTGRGWVKDGEKASFYAL